MRKDPYKVLGVDKNATDEEIKSAYRELAKKFHPDNYVGSPLADLAGEKMKEINDAYDKINRLRQRKESAARRSAKATDTPIRIKKKVGLRIYADS